MILKHSNKRIAITALVGILVCTFYACKPEKDIIIPNKIATELQSYYDSFLREAAIRGKEISVPQTGITLKFGKLQNYAGKALLTESTIIIDSVFWKNTTENWREYLVFHELGHLILQRPHSWAKLPNGEWYSLMWTSEDAPNTNNIIWGETRRKYYLDECFFSSTPVPDWSQPNYNPFPLNTSNRKLIAEQEFDNSPNLQDYLNGLTNAQSTFLPNSLLNVKLPKGFGFYLTEQKVMEWSGLPQGQINTFKQSTNYEIEFRYRINQETKIGVFYGFTSPRSELGIFHNPDLSVEMLSRDIYFKSPNLSFFNPNGQFNVVRVIRQGDFFSIYINNKHFFYCDVFDKQANNLLKCSIIGNGLNADFDLDYYRIYQRQ